MRRKLLARSGALASISLLALALGSLACADDPPACYAGEYAGCFCSAGVSGYAVCEPQTAGYGRCVCDGMTPGLDAGPGDGAMDVSREGGKAERFEPCGGDDDCASGVCFAYGSDRRLCTTACTSPTDCSAPSPGCNGMGVCRAP